MKKYNITKFSGENNKTDTVLEIPDSSIIFELEPVSTISYRYKDDTFTKNYMILSPDKFPDNLKTIFINGYNIYYISAIVFNDDVDIKPAEKIFSYLNTFFLKEFTFNFIKINSYDFDDEQISYPKFKKVIKTFYKCYSTDDSYIYFYCVDTKNVNIYVSKLTYDTFFYHLSDSNPCSIEFEYDNKAGILYYEFIKKYYNTILL